MLDRKSLERLNAPSKEERLENLRILLSEADLPPMDPRYVNCHIHTDWSFSPYSPTAAVYAARAAGLSTAGLVDHDTLAGAEEFLEAGELAGLPVTVGMECRATLAGTGLAGRMTNDPDQAGIAYMTIQSIPRRSFGAWEAFFRPRRELRNARNRRMVERMDGLLPELGLDFERDVLPLSRYAEGGTVTERHLMLALARRLIEQTGRGEALIRRLSGLGIALSGRQRAQLADIDHPFYEHDLLAVLKGAFVPKIYLDAEEECPTVAQLVQACRETDCLLCYAYLGDVTDCVTGDKRAQKFEDSYLEELFACLIQEGVRAVTYAPSRNSAAQLERLRGLCRELGMFQVSGEDINSPRQSFLDPAMEEPWYQDLVDSTWKLIRHERSGLPLLAFL